MTEHIAGTSVDAVTKQVIGIARGGDFRALRTTLLGQPGVLHDRPGIITPHRRISGELDADDLAAQVWAIAQEESSDSGQYTDGYFTSHGMGYYIAAPIDDD